jgi:glucose-6-phosphate isomerase
VVLAGPGLAADAVARTLGRPLTVLHDPDPHRVRALLDDPELLRRTVIFLADDGLATVFRQAYRDLGLSAAEAERHLVEPAALSGTLNASAGALGAATLMPAAFAGVDVAELIDQAELFAPALAGDRDNPALALGLALAGAELVTLVEDGSGLELGEWAADLITSGLGLPVINTAEPGSGLTITLGGSLPPLAVPGAGVAVHGPLGAHLLAWPYAVALAAHVRGLDPFRDYPAETATPGPGAPSFVEGAVEIFTTGTATDLTGALRELLSGSDGPVRIQAFLDRDNDRAVARLRPLLTAASGRPVGFGWGQYHRGGPQHGAFLQITGVVTGDVPVPGDDLTLGGRQAARAAGDRQALAHCGSPLLRLHLTDRTEGVRQLVTAAEMLRHRPLA